jgi:hypothetical protein
MKRQVLTGLLAFGVLSACGEQPTQTPDAGEPVDTSCGIDCASQETYGLIANRCFEYSESQLAQDFPTIGAIVRPVKELEGGVKVMPLEYYRSGQKLMTDNFTFKNGDLYLVRREFGPGESVSYKDENNSLVGVPWFLKSTEAGQNFDATATADVVNGGKRDAVPVTFTVNTLPPTNSQKTMAAGEFPDAITLKFLESPQDNGTDSTRVFNRGTGFLVFSTNFKLVSSDTKLPYYLQEVRDIGEGDVDCGLAQ